VPDPDGAEAGVVLMREAEDQKEAHDEYYDAGDSADAMMRFQL